MTGLLVCISLTALSQTCVIHKRDDFDFRIFNLPYLRSNIPESHAYGVFV